MTDNKNDILTFLCVKRKTNRKTIDRETLFFNLGHQKVNLWFFMSVIEI